jgi:hypothetical protein
VNNPAFPGCCEVINITCPDETNCYKFECDETSGSCLQIEKNHCPESTGCLFVTCNESVPGGCQETKNPDRCFDGNNCNVWECADDGACIAQPKTCNSSYDTFCNFQQCLNGICDWVLYECNVTFDNSSAGACSYVNCSDTEEACVEVKQSCFSFALLGGIAGGVVAGIAVAAAAVAAATVGSVVGATANLAVAEESVMTNVSPIFQANELSGTNPFAGDSVAGGVRP